MNKKEFVKLLKDGTFDIDLKLKCCEFFINNYPVKITQHNPFNPFETQEIWTKLTNANGSKIELNNSSEKSINFAFNRLQLVIKKIEEYGLE